MITGAAKAYIPETGISIDVLQKDIAHLVRRYTEEDRVGIPNEGRLILKTEGTSPFVYSTETISEILRAEGKGIFDSRTAVLGHLQQGGIPTPFDRIRATRLAVNCIDWIQKAAKESSQTTGKHRIYTLDANHSCVIGTIGGSITTTPVYQLLKEVDLKARRLKDSWWLELNRMTRIMAKYEFNEELSEQWKSIKKAGQF